MFLIKGERPVSHMRILWNTIKTTKRICHWCVHGIVYKRKTLNKCKQATNDLFLSLQTLPSACFSVIQRTMIAFKKPVTARLAYDLLSLSFFLSIDTAAASLEDYEQEHMVHTGFAG